MIKQAIMVLTRLQVKINCKAYIPLQHKPPTLGRRIGLDEALIFSFTR